jgi:hypothetical protein
MSGVAASNLMLSLRPTSATVAPSAAERPVAPAQAGARAVQAAARPEVVHAGVSGVVDGLSTVAVAGVGAGVLASMPAALCRMSDIAVVTSSGVLNDVDRARLRTEYGQLSQQVADLIGTAPHATVPAAVAGDAPTRADRDKTGGAPAHDTPEAATGASAVVTAAPTPGMPVSVQHSELVHAATPAHPAAIASFARQAAAPRQTLSVRA